MGVYMIVTHEFTEGSFRNLARIILVAQTKSDQEELESMVCESQARGMSHAVENRSAPGSFDRVELSFHS